MNKNKENKDHVIQVRCTEKENEQLKERVSKSGMKRAVYIRSKLFYDTGSKLGKAKFVVRAQDILNYLEEKYGDDKKLEKWVDELWEDLL